MTIPFRKMHGLGNDFVVLDARARPLRRHRRPRRRHRRPPHRRRLRPVHRAGTGAPTAPMSSCASATPTAARPGPAATPRAASPPWSPTRPAADRVVVRTVAGDLPAEALPGGLVARRHGPGAARLARGAAGRARWTRCICRSRSGRLADPAACSMGNPHATFFVPDLDAVPIAELGPALERDPLFPRARQYRLRAGARARTTSACAVWERGAGHDAGLRLRRLRRRGQRRAGAA